MEGIDLDNILDEDGIDLFNDVEKEETPPNPQEKEGEETPEDKGGEGGEHKETTEVDTDNLFGDTPEGVGSEEEKDKEGEDTHDDKGKGNSPKADFFSSVANALAEEGVFPDLSPDDIEKIKTPEEFLKAVQDQISAGLTEQQNRVKEALDNNVEPNIIRQYEAGIKWLEDISDDTLKDESENGEKLRRQLIYQDFINRGFSKQRAEKETNRSIENGTDVEDAKDALSSNIKFYKDQYQGILDDAKQKQEQEKADREARALSLKKSIMDNDKFFGGDVVIDKKTRQQVFDNISKPVYRDPKTGELYTAIQKFELDNSDEFLAKLGLIFTLTDGFKNLSGLTKGKVRKEVGKGLRDLENKINNTSRDKYGNLKYSSGVDDEESYLGKGVRLAI